VGRGPHEARLPAGAVGEGAAPHLARGGARQAKRRKHKTKQCLREVKKAWRLFEQTCVDTKDLCDIPELWAQAQALGLPRYQYTAREVVSGWHYLAFAQECTLAYSKLFAEVILEHLQNCGVRLKGSRLQTDNGCEFVGNWQAKSDSQFTAAVEAVKGLTHTRCPPRAHTWQSDVETAHRLIEDEFYEVERFTSRSDFLRKTGAYNLLFNVARRNRGKEHKTPWELIHEREPEVDPAVCALPPVFLDELFMKKLDAKLLWGTMLFRIPIETESRFLALSGIVVMFVGLAIRWTAIYTLGRYFTRTVTIKNDHRIIQRGLYRHLRHPAYTGALLAQMGLGLAFTNWLSFMLIFAPILVAALYRMHVEEDALVQAFGGEYVEYAKHTKRLIPKVY
jgi:protein-S-isoprenylcysteine O-methyltransferase Ste14